MNQVELVKDKLYSITADLGFELVELTGLNLGGRSVIRAFIHKQGGVTIDDCKEVSQAFSDYLDTDDPISGRYTLEVSSLGLDRPLTEAADYKRRLQETVNLELKTADGAPGVVRGMLLTADDSGIKLLVNEEECYYNYDEIIRGKIVY